MIILLDHDLEGQVPFLEAGLRETGWDQYLHLEFIRFRELNVPDNATDQAIWRYVQRVRYTFPQVARSPPLPLLAGPSSPSGGHAAVSRTLLDAQR